MPGTRKAAIDFSEYTCNREGYGYYRDNRQDRFDEFLATSAPLRSVGPPAAVEKLARAHHRNRQVDIPETVDEVHDKLIRSSLVSLGLNEHCRVDQESHESRSDRVSPAIMSRRSLAN